MQVLLRVREQGDGREEVHRLWGSPSGSRWQGVALRDMSSGVSPRLSDSTADQGAAWQVVLPWLCLQGPATEEACEEEQGRTATAAANADDSQSIEYDNDGSFDSGAATDPEGS